MTATFEERLNQILPKITSEDFLSGRGLGNEIAFFIFDYAAEDELRMRQHIKFLLEHIPKHKPKLRVAHTNLFDFVIEHLRERKLLDKTLELQQAKGGDFVLRQLEKILHPEKLAPLLAEQVKPDEKDLVLISGVGNVWPLMRTHSLLSNLHPVMGKTPLVMFYPGKYDGQVLRLFGKIKSDNYYRAFRLIP
jgi:hypothetical protein